MVLLMQMVVAGGSQCAPAEAGMTLDVPCAQNGNFMERRRSTTSSAMNKTVSSWWSIAFFVCVCVFVLLFWNFFALHSDFVSRFLHPSFGLLLVKICLGVLCIWIELLTSDCNQQICSCSWLHCLTTDPQNSYFGGTLNMYFYFSILAMAGRWNFAQSFDAGLLVFLLCLPDWSVALR